MSKALMIVPQVASVVSSVVTDGLNVYERILQHRQASETVALQSKTMHRQADLAMTQAHNRHLAQMAQLQTVNEQFTELMQQNRTNSVEVIAMYQSLDAQLTNLMACICQPNIDVAVLREYKEMMAGLREQQTKLIARHSTLGGQALTAFVHSTDSLRDSPRTFTDVF